MADSKRPHYFTRQFLSEADFNDEQAYHIRMRRRHYALQHSWGVVSGLAVTRADDRKVRVAPGTAIDSLGREIVLEDARVHTLQTLGNDEDLYLTVVYAEEPSDLSTFDGGDNFTRIRQRPAIVDSTTTPPADGSVILLALIHLNGSGLIEPAGGIDSAVRTLASTRITAKAIGTTHLVDGAVTPAKLAQEVKPVSVHAANSITVVSDDAQRRVTIGESHSARTANPHAVTAAQIDTQGGQDRIVARINAGAGVISRARIQPEPLTMATGVIQFQSLVAGSDATSVEIDPGLGAGQLIVQLALEDVPGINLTLQGDVDYGRQIRFRAEVNAAAGRFKVTAARVSPSPTGPATIRWYVFKPPPAGGLALGLLAGASLSAEESDSQSKTRTTKRSAADGQARTFISSPE